MSDTLRADPFNDAMRAQLVRELAEFWRGHPHRQHISYETLRQMAMEAAAFARGLAGDVEELRRMMARNPLPEVGE